MHSKNDNKRYIFFIGFMAEGGAERVAAYLCNHLVTKEYPIEILTYYDDIYLYEVDTRVKRTSVEKETGSKNIVKNMMWIRRYCRANAKVIISFLAPFNMVLLVSVFGSGIPVIAADRNDPRRIPQQRAMRYIRNILYLTADRVVVQTDCNKAYFGRLVQRKCHVIYNPVYADGMAGAALRTPKENIIVTAGRLISQKNHKMLIDAFSQVKEKYGDYRLIIYGEGEERNKLQKYIKKLGLAGNVFLPGGKKDPINLIGKARIFVLTSYYEGMPNALLEAMYLGLPVISTKVSGAVDLIKDGVSGYLVDIDDTDKLSEKIVELIEDEDKAACFGINASKTAEKLNIRKISSQWECLISSIENERSCSCQKDNRG